MFAPKCEQFESLNANEWSIMVGDSSKWNGGSLHTTVMDVEYGTEGAGVSFDSTSPLEIYAELQMASSCKDSENTAAVTIGFAAVKGGKIQASLMLICQDGHVALVHEREGAQPVFLSDDYLDTKIQLHVTFNVNNEVEAKVSTAAGAETPAKFSKAPLSGAVQLFFDVATLKSEVSLYSIGTDSACKDRPATASTPTSSLPLIQLS